MLSLKILNDNMGLMKMRKGLTNIEIIDLLRSIAAAYQIRDEKKNRFKIIAYERAADAIEHLSSEAKDLWDDNKLSEIAGIGESIAGHLGEIFLTGNSKHFGELLNNIPQSVFELIKVPGIGPKNGFKLAQTLNVSNNNPIPDLLKRAERGDIAKLEGFGEESQKAIIAGIREFQNKDKQRMLLPYALFHANLLIEWLKKDPHVKHSDVLGSMRRMSATVGDIDIAAASDDPEATLTHFTQYPDTKRIIEKGDSTATILIPPELHVDLMVQEPDSYGSLLQHFTGSKHHNIHLREYAQKKGLSLSEYGIKKVMGNKDSEDVGESVTNKYATEEDFYHALDMEWVPPELREDRGEIEAAQYTRGKQTGLPRLVELVDIKADLQIHSSFDIETSHDLGTSSMYEIAEKANNFKYEYIAFTEHNPSQKGHTDQQITDLLKQKKEAVDKLNLWLDSKKKNNNNWNLKKIFNSLEIDILPKGKLPVPETAFKYLDMALVSVHSSFRLTRNEMTKRVVDALSHPKVKIFAHPTARKINEREGIELDWEKVFDCCLKNDKWLEINADPMRLDLPDILVYEAVKQGVKMTMGTDAHHKDHLDNMFYAVSVARKGWCKSSDIINTCHYEEFEKMLN